MKPHLKEPEWSLHITPIAANWLVAEKAASALIFRKSTSGHIQFWKGTYYSLLNDSDVHSSENTLEMWLFFNVQNEIDVPLKVHHDSVQPGNIYYCTNCSHLPVSVLVSFNVVLILSHFPFDLLRYIFFLFQEFEIEPANNSVCWVRKSKDRNLFVTYINATPKLQYQALRVCFKI